MGRESSKSVFPLPTSRTILAEAFCGLGEHELTWLVCVAIGLNSLWGEQLFNDEPFHGCQWHCMDHLRQQVERFCKFEGEVELVNWNDLWKVKSIDYKGEEVKVARWFSWRNINPALPPEIGRVALEDVCTLGCKHYVQNFELYLRPKGEWDVGKAPRVMVEDSDWESVCRGLVSAGVCCILREDELFHVNGKPLLNGLFGVTKDDFTPDGTEIYRLIMNLIPLNKICLPLGGDIATLPSWSSMSPFFLQPTENLLVSSEDVKCFFYVMSVPDSWFRFLGFNKPVPAGALTSEMKETGATYYLASRVLPMGFLNSVSLAQHVHRNLAQMAAEHLPVEHADQAAPQFELRKDRPLPSGKALWRIYLDNYDLLEKVKATEMVSMEGTVAPGALALRQEYVSMEVPRNEKKSVQRSSKCEVQGATVNGSDGVAYPREGKLAKYFSLALALVAKQVSSQRECQVVCGGLVYFTMFRRALLGSLNSIWSHVESFNQGVGRVKELPTDCQVEILRTLCLLPLAVLDFRLPVHPLVTCSDASTSGGRVCVSGGTTLLGETIAAGGLRGQIPEQSGDCSVLVVGLFDGLGALRVAIESLGIPVIGYVSIEKQANARRVVESHFPGVESYDDVTTFAHSDVKLLAGKYSQACLVVIGAGPPCQGVSGLNADRRGALRDQRSCLFKEVPRIRDLFKREFAWCPTYTLMESVASMDQEDCAVMSDEIGIQPFLCDAADVSWCHRPRLYWCDWEITEVEGYQWESSDPLVRRLRLEGCQSLQHVVKAGWIKVDPSKAFPTFTTSRPSPKPGRKPAGLHQCSQEELERWAQDSHRFPPYQYREVNCLVNQHNVLRVPDPEEREMMLGFPLHYTRNCVPKAQRKGADFNDVRLTLLGNTWSVPVVACLLQPLFFRLGLVANSTPQDILDQMVPCASSSVQGPFVQITSQLWAKGDRGQVGTAGVPAMQLGLNQGWRYNAYIRRYSAGQISPPSGVSAGEMLEMEGGHWLAVERKQWAHKRFGTPGHFDGYEVESWASRTLSRPTSSSYGLAGLFTCSEPRAEQFTKLETHALQTQRTHVGKWHSPLLGVHPYGSESSGQAFQMGR